MERLLEREAEEYGGAGGAPGRDEQKSPNQELSEEEMQIRTYEMLLDQFSLHEFLIRRGATLDTTPEFESFKRAYQPAWTLLADAVRAPRRAARGARARRSPR